jgi:hypothetical protein
MNFKPLFASARFNPISIDAYLKLHKIDNPNEDLVKLKANLIRLKKLKEEGAKCECGNPIWIIGSAFSGMSCFTCLTGEADCSDDYEII